MTSSATTNDNNHHYHPNTSKPIPVKNNNLVSQFEADVLDNSNIMDLKSSQMLNLMNLGCSSATSELTFRDSTWSVFDMTDPDTDDNLVTMLKRDRKSLLLKPNRPTSFSVPLEFYFENPRYEHDVEESISSRTTPLSASKSNIKIDKSLFDKYDEVTPNENNVEDDECIFELELE